MEAKNVEIKRINALSVGKLFGVLYAVLGLIFGVIFSCVSLVGAAGAMMASDESVFGLLFGVGAIIILPIFYGIIGFIGGIFITVIYNFVAGRIGGIEMELSYLNADIGKESTLQTSE